MSLPQTATIQVPIQWVVPSVSGEPIPSIDLTALLRHCEQQQGLLTITQLAPLLQLSVSSIETLIARKRIKSVGLGKRLFHLATVIEQLKETAK